MTVHDVAVPDAMRLLAAPPPPAGYHVEWQVELDRTDEGTPTWGVYSAEYQNTIEDLFLQGVDSMDYQPGRTQTYTIDFNNLTQTRTSCEPGWGTVRRIRRTFVPDNMTVTATTAASAVPPPAAD